LQLPGGPAWPTCPTRLAASSRSRTVCCACALLNDSSSFAHFWHTGALAGRGEALEGRALQLQLRAERPQMEQADFWQWHKDIGTWQFWQDEQLFASREARRTRGRGADAVRGDAVAEGAFAAIAVTAVTAVIAAFAVTAAFSIPAGACFVAAPIAAAPRVDLSAVQLFRKLFRRSEDRSGAGDRRAMAQDCAR
jgi:hypothetical protein